MAVRRAFVHLQVPYLIVPRPWRVGAATFSPAGALLKRLQRRGGIRRRPLDTELLDYIVEPLTADWSTVRAEVTVRPDRRGRPDLDAAIAEAREIARDSISALTLLKDTTTMMDTSLQSFGLAVDVASVTEPSWITNSRGRFLRSGNMRHGSLGPWTITADQMTRYRTDPRFQVLDRALGTPEAERTDWEGRIVSAVRTWTTSNATDRPAIRIVLAATSLEALVGDEYKPEQSATGGHRLAQRAAYLWCGSDMEPTDRHGQPPGRPSCPFLVEPTFAKLRARLIAEGGRGVVVMCSYYDELVGLMDDRNAALHGAETRFSVADAKRHEFTIERILLLALDWAARTGKTSLGDLLEEIAALPSRGGEAADLL